MGSQVREEVCSPEPTSKYLAESLVLEGRSPPTANDLRVFRFSLRQYSNAGGLLIESGEWALNGVVLWVVPGS